MPINKVFEKKIGLVLPGGGARGAYPVSYTHLTLPTNREV